MKKPKKGEIYKTNNYGSLTVLKYINCAKVLIEFEDGTEIYTSAGHIRSGQIRNPNHPIVFGKGYLGIGKYSNKDNKRIYHIWWDMLKRVYDHRIHKKAPTYKECSVSKRWLNFQNFCVDVAGIKNSDIKGWHIDKDILIKGNKKYSKSRCCFVPPEINTILVKKDNGRGKYCIGVCKNKKGLFTAQCSIRKSITPLGSFNSEEEAFLVYKEAKEKEIQRVAKKWKKKLDTKVFKALMNYEVEMDD